MREIHVSVFFPATPEAVFDAVSDHESFLGGRQRSCRMLKTGGEDRNGVGAVREIRTGGYVFVEDITAFERPRGFDYFVRSLSRESGRQLPFRHERGWLQFLPENGGTRVEWRSRFYVAVPLIGWLLERAFARTATREFERLLLDAQRRLAGAAQQAAPAAAG